MLKLNEVTLKFGGLCANQDVSFEVEKGAIFGLIGPNGAGKTTLFNVISGVYKPTGGEVWFDGRRIDGLQPYQINELGIARTYQNINLFKDMSVLENVKVGCHSWSKAGLASVIFRTPAMRQEERLIQEKSMEVLDFLGLSHLAGKMAGSLSYGQQRTLEIARAMASDPKMLLLDEPAAGMNTTEKRELSEDIKKIRERGITVLLVEHDMGLVMSITHTICVLNYGKKIAFGEPEYIKRHPEVIAAYLGGEKID